MYSSQVTSDQKKQQQNTKREITAVGGTQKNKPILSLAVLKR
jgi:hypothetical protein